MPLAIKSLFQKFKIEAFKIIGLAKVKKEALPNLDLIKVNPFLTFNIFNKIPNFSDVISWEE
jgi:hypothetical protein